MFNQCSEVFSLHYHLSTDLLEGGKLYHLPHHELDRALQITPHTAATLGRRLVEMQATPTSFICANKTDGKNSVSFSKKLTGNIHVQTRWKDQSRAQSDGQYLTGRYLQVVGNIKNKLHQERPQIAGVLDHWVSTQSSRPKTDSYLRSCFYDKKCEVIFEQVQSQISLPD
jgi:hypothetical protein